MTGHRSGTAWDWANLHSPPAWTLDTAHSTPARRNQFVRACLETHLNIALNWALTTVSATFQPIVAVTTSAVLILQVALT